MMVKSLWVGFVSVIVLALICTGIYAFTEQRGVAQATLSTEHGAVPQAPLDEAETILGVDANPTGNSGTSLGTINGCISVSSTPPNNTFSIDLVVQDVTNLKSFDGTFRFDGELEGEPGSEIIRVTGVDVLGPPESRYFLATDPDSDLEFHPSSVPNSSGSFQVNAGDRAEAPESGEGTLARLEITAVNQGISKANFDLRPDGYPTSLVQLFDQDDNAIEPVDDLGNFAGTILNAQIAVDEPCPGECLPDVDTDGDGFDDDLECYLPTDPLDACPNNPSHDAWPLDINIDKTITVVGDILNFRGLIGVSYGDPNFQTRLDLNGDRTLTVVGDVLAFRGHVGETCS
jgi:hypothetical protein